MMSPYPCHHLKLDEMDKCDAVLTGLCSKILDTGGAEKTSETTKVSKEGEGNDGSTSVEMYKLPFLLWELWSSH